MSDEKLKGCPIPGCGGAAVASPNKENARVVECSAQGCLTWLPVGLWQALPRPSEAVLEVARELRELERDHSDRLRRGEIVWPWTTIGPLLSRLESAAPVLPAPTREIVAELREQLEQGKRPRMATAWRAVYALESAAPGTGSPGEVYVGLQSNGGYWGMPLIQTFATQEAMEKWVAKKDRIRHGEYQHVHGTPQPKAEACPQCNGTGVKIKRHFDDPATGAEYICGMCSGDGTVPSNTVGAVEGHLYIQAPQRPKAEAGECCICSGIADTFACTECMDLATRANPAHLRSLERDADVLSTIRHRMGGIDNEALLLRVHPTDNAIAPQRPKAEAGSVWVGLTVRMKGDVPVIRDVAVGTTEKEAVANSGDAPIKVYGPLPVIGAPSKGECEHEACTYYQHWADGPVDEDLLKGQLSKALQRAETAERTLSTADDLLTQRGIIEYAGPHRIVVLVDGTDAAIEQHDTALAGEAKAREEKQEAIDIAMAKYTTSDSLWELISEQQLMGWQVAAIGPCQQWVIFKRPKPLEGSGDE